jgi:hypothetical protein
MLVKKERLKEVIDKAKLRIDIDIAQNPELQRAIHIVEAFLHRTQRMCYGGQAINAHLPQHEKFYNSQRSLPDYDFFTPEAQEDTEEIIEDLKKNGYTEISKRIGIHDGTIKIYVNYMPIADITQMIPEFYNTIHKQSMVVDGIRYVDPLFLRMLMHLELSRPRGQVERWEKVYERLLILHRNYPLKACKFSDSVGNSVAKQARPAMIRYILDNKLPYMGIDLHKIYMKPGPIKRRMSDLLKDSSPVICFSPNAIEDATKLAEITSTETREHLGFQNILPAIIALYRNDVLAGIVVQEEACHSIIQFPVSRSSTLYLSSLDTAITFFIGLYYRDDIEYMPKHSLLCAIKHLIDLSNRYRVKPTKLFPDFSIECDGYQTSFASLLRAKAARIQAERQRVSSGRYEVTRKRKTNKNTVTRKDH